jgi:indole-3-acetate monooxygenase
MAAESVEAMLDSGLLAALAPVEAGGYQVDPLTEMELIEAISAIDGSAGWTFMIVAGSTARAASMMPDEALADVFRPGMRFPQIVFQEAAFGNTLQPTRQGLIVSGTWPFCTGLAHADWVLAIGQIAGYAMHCPFPEADTLAAIIPIAQVKILDTWDVTGLAGTSTFTYQIDSSLAPWHRVWAYPPRVPIRGGAHFCFRRAPIKHIGFALGVAASSLNDLSAHIAERTSVDRKPRSAISLAIARSALGLRAARALAVEVITEVWQEASETLQVADSTQRRLRATACFVTETAAEVCRLVTHYGGASSLSKQNPLQRNLCDIQVGLAHAEVGDVALENFGAGLITEALAVGRAGSTGK